MTRTLRWTAGSVACATVLLLLATPAFAGSHLWKINEVFSNADGTIQFLELKECCGADSEIFMNGKIIISQGTGKTFTFNHNLAGPTGNKHLLIGTLAYKAIVGAPKPDFLLPDNFIKLTGGDTLEYSPAQNYDEFIFPAGALPLDGVHSIQLTGYFPDAYTVGVNTPTNYAGQSGSIDLTDLALVSADPPDGAIDARQPFEPGGHPGLTQGWDYVDLTFDGDVSVLSPTSFSTTTEGPGVGVNIAGVEVLSEDTARVYFSSAIPQLTWTTITHIPSGMSTTLGALPGDVNGDKVSGVPDVLSLVDALNGVQSLPEYSTDIDHSGISGAPDILRLIDLLNGAGFLQSYNGAVLP